MNPRALLMAAAIAALLPSAAQAESAPDPFASETPLDEAALAKARGGLMINGFLIDFAIQTQLIIDSAGSLPAGQGPIAFDIDPSIDTLIINNTLDGVEVSRIVSLNVAIPNFDMAISSAVSAGAGADLTPTILSLGGF